MTHATSRGPAGAIFGTAILAAAVGALCATLLAPQPQTAPAHPADSDLRAALEAVTARLGSLEARLEARPAPLRSAEAPAQTPPPAEGVARRAVEPEGASGALLQRIAKLEQRLAAQEQSKGTLPTFALPRTPPDPAELARQKQTHQATILDATASQNAKLEAWGSLRSQEDAYTDAVVAEMVHVGLSSTDPDVRANVWRQADGRSTHDGLVPALLQALQSDAESNVREEAAETLENYAHLAHVAQALEFAKSQDPDEGVRRYAERSLQRARR